MLVNKTGSRVSRLHSKFQGCLRDAVSLFLSGHAQGLPFVTKGEAQGIIKAAQTYLPVVRVL